MTTAIVTGAARGIGLTIARRLSRDHDHLILVDISPALGEATVEIEQLGVDVTPVQVDLTTPDGVATVRDKSDGATLLVNNAGITRDARLVNMTRADFDLVIAINARAGLALTEALAPVMTDGGSIVNIASRAYLGNFGQFNYSISKGAVVGMTRAHAIDLAPRLRVNAIAPGLINTEMVKTIPEDVINRMVSAIPLARMGEPEEVAELVAFLGSERASYLTGQVAVIGGGRSLT